MLCVFLKDVFTHKNLLFFNHKPSHILCSRKHTMFSLRFMLEYFCMKKLYWSSLSSILGKERNLIRFCTDSPVHHLFPSRWDIPQNLSFCTITVCLRDWEEADLTFWAGLESRNTINCLKPVSIEWFSPIPAFFLNRFWWKHVYLPQCNCIKIK